MSELNSIDLTQPLIDEENLQAVPNGRNKKHEFQKKKVKVKNIVFLLISSIGCTAFFLYMIISKPHAPLVDLSMTIGAILTVALFIQRIELEKIGNAGEATEKLKAKTKLLKEANERLSITAAELENEFDTKTRAQQKLDFIISIQGITTKNFLRLIKEKKRISEKSTIMMKHQTLENIFSFILKVDSNENFSIEEKDLIFLILKLRNIDGLRDLDIDQFKHKPDKKSFSISCLVETCFHILEESEIRNKRIDQLLDEGSQRTKAFNTKNKFPKNVMEDSKSDIENCMFKHVSRTLGSAKEKRKSDLNKVTKFKTLYELSDEYNPSVKHLDGNSIDTEGDEAKSDESTEAQSSFKNSIESINITDGNLTFEADIQLSRGVSESNFSLADEKDHISDDTTDENPRFEGIFRTSIGSGSVQNITALYELDEETKDVSMLIVDGS